MQLSRDAIQRMIGNRSSFGTGGGSGGGVSPESLALTYVSIPYFNQFFKIYGKKTVTIDGEVDSEEEVTLPPNTMPERSETTDEGVTTVTETVITRIEALFDFNSVGGVSALGYNPGGGGGGGGADLNALLASINSSSIGSTTPTSSETGKCLVWTASGWAWGTTGGGGGGTVTNVSTGTGLTGGPITSIGTISINTTYQNYIAHGQAAYEWGNHANAGYLKTSGGSMTGALSMKGVNIYLDPVNSGNNTTGDIVFRYGSGSEKARLWMDNTFTSALGPQYRCYDTNGNLLVSTRLALASDLASYATQSWVNQQGFVKSSGVTSVGLSMPTGFSVSGSPVTSSGTLAVSMASGYFIPTTSQRTTWNNKQDAISDLATIRSNASHGETAYNSLGNYLLKEQGMRFLVQDSYIAARFVTASGAYDSTRAGKAQGDGYIEWWSTGGYFNHRMGSVSIYDGEDNDTCYLQIGGGRIYWDPQSKALYVVQADGTTAANFYATGGVSALGFSAGSTPEIANLTITGRITLTSGSSHEGGYAYIYSDSDGNMVLEPSEYLVFGNNIDMNGLSLLMGGGNMYMGGGRIYLDGTRYLYLSGSSLMYYNGSQYKVIA